MSMVRYAEDGEVDVADADGGGGEFSVGFSCLSTAEAYDRIGTERTPLSGKQTLRNTKRWWIMADEGR